MNEARHFYEPYIGKLVGIGVDNWNDPKKPFYYYGVVLEIGENAVRMRDKKGGLRLIKFSEIREVSVGVY